MRLQIFVRDKSPVDYQGRLADELVLGFRTADHCLVSDPEEEELAVYVGLAFGL